MKLKRPLAAVGLSMLATLFILCFFGGGRLVFAVFAGALFCLLISLTIKKLRQGALLPTVFGSVALSCLLLFGFELFVFMPVESFCTDNGEITAVIREYAYESSNGNRLYLVADLTALNGSKAKGRVRLSFPAKPWKRNTPILPEDSKLLEPGDKVVFTGKLYKIAGSNASIHNHFKSKGICLAAYPLQSVTVEKQAVKNLYTVLMKERKRTMNQILNAFDADTASVIIAVLMGDKQYLSSELYSAFGRSGTAHLLAVSGLHLSIWIMFLVDFLKKRNALSKPKILFLICFVFMIMFFAAFSGSVKRAGIMMLLYLLSELFGERADSLNSLGFSAVCILFLNPYSAVNASFLLSFVSTLTIIIIAVPVADAVNSWLEVKTLYRFPKPFKSAVVCFFISLFVNLATLPFQIQYFGGVSTLGVVANLLLLPVTAPLILGSGLYVMFYFVPVFSSLLYWLSKLCVLWCEKIVLFVSSFRYSYLELDESFVLPAAAVSVGVPLLSLFLLKKRKKRLDV